MVKTSTGGVDAYQWAGDKWDKIGEVVSAVGNRQKQVYNGQEYDYVFDVDIKEGSPPLKLPYNANENPYLAAQRFLEKNELPLSYLDETAKFIEQNTGGVQIGTSAPATDPYADRYIPPTAGAQPAANLVSFCSISGLWFALANLRFRLLVLNQLSFLRSNTFLSRR